MASAGPYANNLHLAPDRKPHQHLINQFLQTGCSSWHPTNSIKALKAQKASVPFTPKSWVSDLSFLQCSDTVGWNAGNASDLSVCQPTVSDHWGTRSSAIAEGLRNASCQLKSCQLPCNSAETTCTTSPEQIKVMKLEGYSGTMCNKHVHSTMKRSSRFHCPIGVINKPTTVELWISPVYRRLSVAKFSKSTM